MHIYIRVQLLKNAQLCFENKKQITKAKYFEIRKVSAKTGCITYKYIHIYVSVSISKTCELQIKPSIFFT